MQATLQVTLKTGNNEMFIKGHTFTGKLEDFPEDVQILINDKSSYVKVTEDLKPKEVSKKEEPIKEAPKPKKVVKTKLKKKTNLKR